MPKPSKPPHKPAGKTGNRPSRPATEGKPANKAHGKGQKFAPRPGKPDHNRDEPRSTGFKPSHRGGKKPFRADKPHAKPVVTAKAAVPAQPMVTPRHGRGQLLHGMHAVREAWLNPQRQCHQLWLTAAAENEFAPTIAAAVVAGLNRPAPQRTERPLLDAMLPGAIHQGIALDAAPLPELDLAALIARQPKLLIVLDQVTDPHNVGAVLRSAAAFGAAGVILTERHAPGMTGTLAKSASGALEHVPLVPVVNLARALEQLREAGFWCVGLAEEGTKALHDHDLSGATALVLGAEGDGLRRLTRERCDALAHLPTQGAIGSLNVSNAAAVALYEARQQQTVPEKA